MPNSSVFSSITRASIIFVSASLFPYSLSLIVAMFVINHGIECFTYLVIAYVHHFTHILFVYKLVSVLFKLGV